MSTKTSVKKLPSELKAAVANFQDKMERIKNFESNPYKITSMIISDSESDKKSSLPDVPAYQRYHYLADFNISSLILPYQYKKLSEIYQSLDTVVSILYNRKEKIYFDKVQEDVQKIMKRNLSKTDIGQIVTIVPAAFDIKLKKCNFKNSKEPKYELMLSPNIRHEEKGKKASKCSKFVVITPQDLMNRKKQFDENLLQRVHDYHQIFLSRHRVPPAAIEKIKRWHPKFPLDSVPSIEVAILPENKSIAEKRVKAFKEVAEKLTNEKNTEIDIAALKIMRNDLIAEIQAVGSNKLLEFSPDQFQRKALLERLPKIMQILWDYFVVQRKTAMHIDAAVEKIINSFCSLSSHETKALLSLIYEEFPGWISFVEISKGLYITMNKSRDLNEMLKNFKCE